MLNYHVHRPSADDCQYSASRQKSSVHADDQRVIRVRIVCKLLLHRKADVSLAVLRDNAFDIVSISEAEDMLIDVLRGHWREHALPGMSRLRCIVPIARVEAPDRPAQTAFRVASRTT